jgi:hypothetical protein
VGVVRIERTRHRVLTTAVKLGAPP